MILSYSFHSILTQKSPLCVNNHLSFGFTTPTTKRNQRIAIASHLHIICMHPTISSTKMPQYLRTRRMNSHEKDTNPNAHDNIIHRQEKLLPNHNNGNSEMVETTVIYPKSLTLDKTEPIPNLASKSSSLELEPLSSSSQPTQKLKRSSPTARASSSSSEECPPLFFPSSQSYSPLPSFPQRLQCNTMMSISNHPSLYLTAIKSIKHTKCTSV